MQIDKTTHKDLSIFTGTLNVFDLVNRCETHIGAAKLKTMFAQPPAKYEKLREVQEAVVFWQKHLDYWPTIISNGTVVMLHEFFEASDGLHYKPSSWLFSVDAALQRVFNKNAFSLLQFSAEHLLNLYEGLNGLLKLKEHQPPKLVAEALASFTHFLEQPAARELGSVSKKSSLRKLMHVAYNARRSLKRFMAEVLEQFAKMDAWHSMALANKQLGFHMPQVSVDEPLHFRAQQLFHPLLERPVKFDLELSEQKKLLFLTGANMSGKSTLLRSLGIAALLAHIGMGVPADKLEISFLDGIITNMQVEDNIFLGESYFMAEVKRMKLTAKKLHNHKRHLVLMDELFKGTNVHDAYECSKAVIALLLQQENNLMALSTHLYELYPEFEGNPHLLFKYCNTEIGSDQQYHFTYKLKDGVSNDKIGFLVLKNEGVLDILNAPKQE